MTADYTVHLTTSMTSATMYSNDNDHHLSNDTLTNDANKPPITLRVPKVPTQDAIHIPWWQWTVCSAKHCSYTHQSST